MSQSPIGSPMLKARSALVLDLPDEAWFDVAFMQKDLRLALDTAAGLHMRLPSTVVADEMLTAARADGYEHRDIAVLYQVLSDLAAAQSQSSPAER
jgi:3-hydroxyisobutyrate dehydrogenase